MRLRHIFRNTAGSLALETALSLMASTPLVFSIFQICLVSYTYATLNDSVRQGVRYAVSHGTDSSNCSGPSAGCADSTAANVQAVVQQEAKLSAQSLSGMVVTVNYPDGTSTPSSRVQVQVQFPYTPIAGYSGFQQTMNLSAEGRIVY
jgi:Flp pilus assembly protein TadG